MSESVRGWGCALITNLPLMVAAYVLTELADRLVGKEAAAVAGGAVLLTVVVWVVASGLYNETRHKSLRSALQARPFRQGLAFLFLILPGPALGLGLGLIT
jgi:hypothetical protein